MKTPRQAQRGALMVATALFIVVLVGIGTLALDLGRLFILKTQMQNAVDAAALAAAAELTGGVGLQRVVDASDPPSDIITPRFHELRETGHSCARCRACDGENILCVRFVECGNQLIVHLASVATGKADRLSRATAGQAKDRLSVVAVLEAIDGLHGDLHQAAL